MSANKAIDKIESNEAISKKKKKETREATGASSGGQYAAPLFGEPTPKPQNPKTPTHKFLNNNLILMVEVVAT